jgi:ceramide glucosyltransferase
VLHLAVVPAALALGAVAYYALCLWGGYGFLRDCRRLRPAAAAPPVSILKPLRGTDPGMYEALRSHCLQDYPEYEILFGVADAEDPAVALVRRLQAEFPRRSLQLVICPRALGCNLKISSLAQMLPAARHEYLLVNDSDIEVPPDYLRRVMAPFADGATGMVTTLYRGMAAGTLWSRLEALSIATDFAPGVLAARRLEGISFGLGSTLAFPRARLEEIGGFAPLLDWLADDYELGNRIAHRGRLVVLSDVVVATHLPAYGFGEFWKHQLRWARGIRGARAWSYLGLAVSFGVPWALLALLLARGAPWAWGLLAVTALLRAAVSKWIGGSILHNPQVMKDFWLIPLRDAVGMAIWLAGFFGSTVTWRGNRFRLKGGKLHKTCDL